MPIATTVSQHPRRDQYQIPQAAVAAASSSLIPVRVPRAGTVQAVYYVPVTTITGAATNNRTHSVINKGQAGAGTTVAATLNYASGTNAPANQSRIIALSGTAADLNVAEGDVLNLSSAAVGTGIADPGGIWVLELGAPVAGN